MQNMVALRSISVSEVMLRGIGLHQSVNITVPIDDVLEALRTSRLSMGVRMREKYIIKKLTWMLVNVAVSPLPDIMKNQETPENFLDPLV